MDLEAEAEQIQRAAQGDLKAMEMIYMRYKTMAFAAGMAICGNGNDADDVVQETFLRAFRKLVQWRGESRFSTWLYTIAVRTAQNWKSRFTLRTSVPLTSRDVTAMPQRDEQDAQQEVLHAAIATLPEQQRLTLMLKHIRGLSIREIAHLQECAEGTVKANLHHALVTLMRRLGKVSNE